MSQMKVKGEAMVSLPMFIAKNFGKDKLTEWLKALPDDASRVYSKTIDQDAWYPLGPMMSEPTRIMCKMFYDMGIRGARECGRFSADYGLKGLAKMLVKLSNPQVLIKKASTILPKYYQPCEMHVVETSSNLVVLHITEFPEMDRYIENRIAGWMERAIEINGCKNVRAAISKSLTKGNDLNEYRVTWK